MSENETKDILLIDADADPRLSEEEAQALKEIQKKFMESYAANYDKMELADWLVMEMKEALPECSAEETEEMSQEILSSLKTAEEKRKALAESVKTGRSKESWFASEMKKATSYMEVAESAKYLQSLDNALESANEALYDTITTKLGTVSQNPNLDGFIAEQYHAQTFNMNAEAAGSPYRARVLEPGGNGYAKNSVDIVIEDAEGNIVRRYQSKYCNNAASTAEAFEHGNYRGQRKLVPTEQLDGIPKKATDCLEMDGVTSNPLTKSDAKRMQREAQSGNWNELNWNEYHAKDLAIGIGKQAGQAALFGAAIGTGIDIAAKICNGEEIDGEEVVETALKSGADIGVKAAAAGALKVGAEKGIVSIIPKGTPAGTIANIAYVGIENVKVMGKIATGELTVKEGLDQMEQVTVSTAAGIAVSAQGAAVGAAIGTVFGPVGTIAGGLVGGTVGYIAGSKIGQKVVETYQKVRDTVIEVVKDVGSAIGETISSIGDALFGWLF